MPGIVRYHELAVRNEYYCVARDLVAMARAGICMEKDVERAKAYWDLIPLTTACRKF